MKLDQLFNSSRKSQILDEYLLELKKVSKNRVLLENVNEDIVDKAIAAGNFENPQWTRQLINGLKQVGVHGLNIPDEDRPITLGEMRKVIVLLLDLIGRK